MNINSFKNHLIENNLLTPSEYAQVVDKYYQEQNLTDRTSQIADAGLVQFTDDLVLQWGVSSVTANAGISGQLVVPLVKSSQFLVIPTHQCTTVGLLTDGSKYSIVSTKSRPVQWYAIGAPSTQDEPMILTPTSEIVP